ncbi:MAG: DDE-type integrase/transposase/recombinase [Chromatiales bacterium]|nr:DDE-type integrase/transposase/recombinase [Chromatiales bacterium]
MSDKALPPLSLEAGATVYFRGRRHLIHQESANFETVVLVDPNDGQLVEASIADLSPSEAPRAPPVSDLATINPEALEEAERRYEVIRPLLDNPARTKADVIAAAEEYGVHVVTLYRWLSAFETTGKVSVLVRQVRKDKGHKTLPKQAESIVNEIIETKYLKTQQLTVQKTIDEIKTACRKAGIKPPHANTIRSRIKALSTRTVTAARRGRKAARDESLLIQGSFPGADTPLALVQVDHTLLDIVVVDEQLRESIGRPWLTLLFDVFSGMVLGFYISLDPPGNLSLGLCLAHAFLDKDEWLAKRGIETKWPCWGKPRTIHADNAREFRGNMLKNACREYDIDLEWRPVATPRYGAHVERYLGTLAGELHALPGTTFSKPEKRGEYDSDKESAMTLPELEQWVTTQIVEVYHQKRHSSIGVPPIAKWNEGILGTKSKQGIGIPDRITDTRRLKLDLMPFEERTVQHYGIIWDHVHYSHDILRRWVNAKDPQNPGKKRKFLCRRDPRDISVIWFYDPDLEEYFAIPYRNTSRPVMSLWELREALRRIAEERAEVEVNEQLIFDAYEKLRHIEETAKKTTKKTRRNKERHRMGVANAREHVPAISESADVVRPDAADDRPERVDILPFDDFDDMLDDGDG